jgi:hypothetical protein
MAPETGGRALSPPRALLYATGTVGFIDFVYPTLFALTRGRPWFRPWQGVASAVLGPESMTGGYASASLGILLHFTVAACISWVYLAASRWLPILRQRYLAGGLVFGGIAFFVMNLVVIPLTRIGRQPLRWTAFAIGGLLLHVLLLGPFAAYFASRAAWSGGREP